tara:strand:- start:9500 stop:10435 length:936 start_codon:yes stop_codon:yes gene_type:complete
MNYDYQWPDASFKLDQLNKKSKAGSRVASIESFFEKRFNKKCLLFPSARSAMMTVLSYKNVNRSHIAFVPKWTSHCVWGTVARFANPTCINDKIVNYSMRVNKWGYSFNTEFETDQVINSSVDSLFTDSKLLLNGSNFELISLPKILGTVSGGIVCFDDKNFHDYVIRARNMTSDYISSHQFKSKLAQVRGEPELLPWDSIEYLNLKTQPDENRHIASLLDNYKLAEELISERMNKLKNLLNLEDLKIQDGRLPCLVPVKEEFLTDTSSFMRRNFNFSLENEIDKFEPIYLLPVHIGISETEFNEFCSFIK